MKYFLFLLLGLLSSSMLTSCGSEQCSADGFVYEATTSSGVVHQFRCYNWDGESFGRFITFKNEEGVKIKVLESNIESLMGPVRAYKVAEDVNLEDAVKAPPRQSTNTDNSNASHSGKYTTSSTHDVGLPPPSITNSDMGRCSNILLDTLNFRTLLDDVRARNAFPTSDYVVGYRQATLDIMASLLKDNGYDFATVKKPPVERLE